MSLLQKASIITTPTAYAEDYLYSIKPAYALGSELVTNGDFTNGSNNWNVQTGWSIANGIATVNHNATTAITQSLSGVRANFLYEIKLTISNYTQGLIQPQFSGQVITQFTGNGEHTFQVVSTSSTPTLYLYAISNPQFSIDNVSVKEVTDADFDFDRNSTGTRVNEDYLIEDVPYNFLTYSTDFTSWQQADTSTVQIEDSFDNSNNAYKVSVASASGFQTIRNTGLSLLGQQTFSVYAKKDTLNFIRILIGGFGNFWVDLVNGTQGATTGSFDSITITNAGNGFFKIVATFTATSSVNHIYLYPSIANGNVVQSSGSVIFQYAQLVKGDQPKDYLKTTDRLDIPRIDYTNGEPSILLEPQRTNLEDKSNEFSTWSSNSNITRTAAYTQSPEGLNNATRLQFTANGFCSNKTQALATYTMSCYAKRNDSGTQNVGFFTNGSGTVNSAWEITSEWKRFSYAFPALNGGAMGIAGVSGADISVYGFQLEGLVSYATSYIPTSGSAVTRSADAANNAGNSDLINSTEGVLYAEFKGQNDNTFNYISVSDGGTTNYAAILCSDVDNEIAYRYYVSNSGVQIVTSVSNLLEFNKIAVKWKVNDFSIYINGVQVGASTSGSVNSAGTFNNVSFARGTSNNTPFYGNFKSVMVFKEALTDLELEKLTGYNNHELYMNYYNRLSYLGLAEEYNVESDINNYIL